jgi:hypothetical protein
MIVDTTIPFRDETIALSACWADAEANAANGSKNRVINRIIGRPKWLL